MLLGKRLIKAIIQEQNFSKLKEYDISKADVFGDAIKAWDWLEQHIKDYAAWPTVKMLEDETGIKLPDDIDTLEYICDQVRRRTLTRNLSEGLKNVAELVEDRKPDEALDAVKTLALSTRAKVSNVVSFKEDGTNRIKRYDDVAGTGGYVGIETFWESLNKQVQGWVNGTFNVVVGKTNSGKSWLSLIIANHCMQLGYKVLLVSMEMIIPAIERRLDALKYKLAFKDVRDASLDMFKLKEWKDKIKDEDKLKGDILLADKRLVQRVTDVVALVYEHKPNIVIIDGGYRFKGVGKTHWESSTSVISDLQAYSGISGIPWIITTQHNPGDGKKGMSGWNVRYAREWLIDPDVVIGINQDEDLRLLQRSELHILKVRESAANDTRNKVLINWDMENMDFTEIKYEEKDAEY